MEIIKNAKPEFVSKHEIGKVYKNIGHYYLLAYNEDGNALFVSLTANTVLDHIVYPSLEAVDKDRFSDILVEAQLLIKE